MNLNLNRSEPEPGDLNLNPAEPEPGSEPEPEPVRNSAPVEPRPSQVRNLTPAGDEFATAIKAAGLGTVSASTAKNIRTEILDRTPLPQLD